MEGLSFLKLGCQIAIRLFAVLVLRPVFVRVNMQPSCVSHVQNVRLVSPSEARRILAGKTHMFRCVFLCFCLFSWGVFLGFVVPTLPI